MSGNSSVLTLDTYTDRMQYFFHLPHLISHPYVTLPLSNLPRTSPHRYIRHSKKSRKMPLAMPMLVKGNKQPTENLHLAS
jgi:hypothetical protein